MEDIKISVEEYKNLLDTEARVSILYAFYLKGECFGETVATVMGWQQNKKEKKSSGFVEELPF